MLILLLVLPVQAQTLDPAAADPVDAQLAVLTTLFTAEPASVLPGGYADLFAPSFRDAVPDAQLTAIFLQYWMQGGAVIGLETVSKTGPSQGVFILQFEKGIQVPVKGITVDAEPPHLISGVLLGLPEPIEKAENLAVIVEEFASRPGANAFLAAELMPDGSVRELGGHMVDTPLALGSAFKLYVLGRLTADIEMGDRSWSDVVELDPRVKSLPSGISQSWPDRSPITLHTLATLMISVSDNTATDLLIETLGRDRVMAFQADMGHTEPGLNHPFLTTREMFAIKGNPQMADAFAAASPAARRRMLDSIADAQPDGDSFPTTPTHIDTIEWFASARDMASAMAWFVQDIGSTDRNRAREILSINPGLDLTGPYVGYKGGSEPGVLNMTFLLQSSNGRWLALTASQNDTTNAVDMISFSSLMKQAAALLTHP